MSITKSSVLDAMPQSKSHKRENVDGNSSLTDINSEQNVLSPEMLIRLSLRPETE